MQPSFQISPRAEHCRQQIDDARKRAALASDQTLKAAFEAVANHWVKLTEQVEWVERNKIHVALSGRKEPTIGGVLAGLAMLGLTGFALLVAIGAWDRHSSESGIPGTVGASERHLPSQLGSSHRAATERPAQARVSRGSAGIEE
jgi:hypothetical protein